MKAFIIYNLIVVLLSMLHTETAATQTSRSPQEFENRPTQMSDELTVGNSTFPELMFNLKYNRPVLNSNKLEKSDHVAMSSDGVEEAWVSHYASGLFSGNDVATAMIVDPSNGDVFVTGYSMNPGFGRGYFTVKYDASGNEVWTAQYAAVQNGDDRPLVICLDMSGNVYVTGLSWDPITAYDFATIKYNSLGQQQWVTRYNGPQNDDDGAVDLAIDNMGNAYVTGISSGSSNQFGYVTIKYNSAGSQEWVARYYSPFPNSDDFATAIAIDDARNVYVTGKSNLDYATLKYDSLGAQQWVARYPGIIYGANGATDIAVDDSGNVYVTGWDPPIPGNIYDYATIKYNSDGAEQWVRHYDNGGQDIPSAIVIDDSVNVYVTGSSPSGLTGNNRDYATIKYNSDGSEQWIARYNGGGDRGDEATALALDNQGNVFVTGVSHHSWTQVSYATIKYSGSGEQIWVVNYDSPVGRPGDVNESASAIATDDRGNVYVTGWSEGTGTALDYATVKYNGDAEEQWVTRYDGATTSFDAASDLAVDNLGNVFVTGNSLGRTGSEILTVKYGADGSQEWTSRYIGPDNKGKLALAIELDDMGNAYVAGNVQYGSSGYVVSDFLLIKYSSRGIEQWVQLYDHPGLSSDEAGALAVDKSGQAYLTGEISIRGTSERKYATIKYDSEGNQQWVTFSSLSGKPNAAVTDDFGNLYVTGHSGGQGTGSDYTTVKYSDAGDELWVARFNGPSNKYDVARAIAVDDSGNVYVTGSGTDMEGVWTDYVTIMYSGAGDEIWAARFNGSRDTNDRAFDLTVDSAGNAYVTGENGSGNFLTIKYDHEGVEQWIARYDGPAGGIDTAKKIALDRLGNVYVTGNSRRRVGIGNDDFATIKYNSEGIEQWVARYNGSGHATDLVTQLYHFIFES